jgi:predicted kinase
VTRIIVPADSALYRQLRELARHQRFVFFAGLPGTGKSLLIHQLAHWAAAEGRVVHLLQWDVARPLFENHAKGREYPQVAGVTHGVIRKAVGLWARSALVRWHLQHAAAKHLLIGETPLIGHRLIELARRDDDEAERLLAGASCVFAIPVPSAQIRNHIAAERQRRAMTPLHPRETEDARPEVMQALWHELVRVAQRLGIIGQTPALPEAYDTSVYRRVYQTLLQHRRVRVMPLDILLPTATVSAYDMAVGCQDIGPSAAEVRPYIQAAERLYKSPEALQRDMEQWYRV